MGTSIEWTEATWNPTTGCDKVSPGCDNCYAMTLAKRLKGMGSAKYQRDGDPRTSGPGFGVSVHPDSVDLPLRWRKPRRIFVNSMSDLFHQEIPDEFVARVFAVMAQAEQHTFQVLTKRHGRMRSLLRSPEFAKAVDREWCGILDWYDGRIYEDAWMGAPWPLPNVWQGVSVEDQHWAGVRIPALIETPAAVPFLSCEPLLGPLDLTPWLHGIGWVIVGGESGPGFRPMDPQWARDIRDQCAEAGVPFLFKQHGGRTPKAGGRELDGRTHDDYPSVVA